MFCWIETFKHCQGLQSKQSNRFQTVPEMALGSLFELETQLIMIEELSIISTGEMRVVLDQLNKEQKMMNNLIGKVKANS